MRVLGLDLATKCGWATSIEGKISYGTEDFVNKQWDGAGMRYLKFEAFLQGLLWPDLVVYEAVERHDGGTYSAHVYGGYLAVVQRYCEHLEIPYTGFGVSQIKKFWTGKGNASKEMMIDAAFKRGYNPKDDNAADALAILHLGLEHYASLL